MNLDHPSVTWGGGRWRARARARVEADFHGADNTPRDLNSTPSGVGRKSAFKHRPPASLRRVVASVKKLPSAGPVVGRNARDPGHLSSARVIARAVALDKNALRERTRYRHQRLLTFFGRTTFRNQNFKLEIARCFGDAIAETKG